MEAEEVVIYLSSSKTDQYNVGTARNHWRSGDELLCPVRAWLEYARRFPQRLWGSEHSAPLAR